MSSGASIPHLLRVHFYNTGHPDARLSPLTLDFQREDELGRPDALDSVIWAENGVGKSSIRALLFSLLHPNIHDVMRSSSGPLDNRRYELFFGPKDSAFVVTEWLLPPKQQHNLKGFPEEPHTLIIGFTAHWPRNHQTTLSDLDRHFFMFRPRGMATFDRLPIRGLAKGSEAIPHAKAFMEWFKAQAKSVDGRHTTIHKEWSRWLEEEGLDPVIFAYQLRMNSGQGGILGLFKNRINSPTDFVHFFLETVLSHEAAGDVVDVLNEKKIHIEKKPQWEAEVNFVNEAIPLLHTLQQEKAAFAEAETALEADLAHAGALITALDTTEQHLRIHAEDLRFKAREAERFISEKQNHQGSYQDYRSWLRYHECMLDFEEAENSLAESRKQHRAARDRFTLLKATLEYGEWQAKLDECKAIEGELTARESSHLDLETSLRNAGAALAAVLDREITRAKTDLDLAKSELTLSRKSLLGNQKEFNRTKTELGKIKEAIRGINAQMQNREKVLRRLVHSQVLTEEEPTTDAITRWKAGLREARRNVQVAMQARRDLDAEKKHLLGLQQDHVVRLTRCRAECDHLQKLYDTDSLRKKALENNSDLCRLTGEQTVHLANADLPNLIRERINRFQQEIFTLSRRLADDRETLEVIEQSDSKLYPPPPEVARLLRVLREDLHLPAYLGTEELDNKYPHDPEEAERLFTRDPARFMGIMVPTRDDLENVKKAESLHRPAFPVQVSFSGGDLCVLPHDAVVLRPGHQAAFNREAALNMVKPLTRRITENERLINELQDTVKRLQEVLNELLSFLETYPKSSFDLLKEKKSAKITVLTDLERIQQKEQERLANIDVAFADHTQTIQDSEQRRQQCESAIDRLRDFIEDHESQHRELRTRLMETRAQLHLQEDKAMRLEATLEEDHHLVSERQETVFHTKSELDRRREEQRSLIYKDGEVGNIKDLTLTESETTYRLYLDRFKKVSEKDETLRARLEEKQAMALEREKRYRKELGAHSDLEVVNLLEEGRIEERLQAAEQQEQATAMAVGGGEGGLNAARERLREAPTISLDYKPPKEEDIPDSVEAAKLRRGEIDAQLETWRNTIDQQKEELSEFKDRIRQLNEDLTLRKLKREELLNHVPEFTQTEEIALPRDNDELKEVLDHFWQKFRADRKGYSDTKLALDAGCTRLKDLAGDPRFQDFPNDKREILKISESLLRQTDDIVKEFLIFRDVIHSSLRMSEESTEAIVTRLDANISDALHLINLARSSSRLPDAMEGWGGFSFIKMDILGRVPTTLEDRRPIYERVLREALKSGKPLRGLDLIKRGIDALAGTKGFRVVVLKPGYALKSDYHHITDVKGWSDGEKITSVILIYCTMVQLRAQSTGGKSSDASERRTISNGMLFLDNPFGEANSLTFVNMQLTMAHALNIQLIYTASGSHKHLMARFPRVIRLSQEMGTEKTFVKAADVGQEVRASVNVSAAHFGRRRAG